MKQCNKCKEDKPLTQFRTYRKNKLRATCKACESKRQSERYKEQGGSVQREYHLQNKYGLSLHEYDQKLASQGGLCAVCLTDNPGSRGRFCVDHNHQTGEVRGLLCATCNQGIGLLQDNPATLTRAATYLEDRGYYG